MPKRIMVAGSANMDVVLNLRELPARGESVLADTREILPGGKGANRAVALARLGGKPLFSCAIGADDYGGQLFELYRNEEIDTSLISRLEENDTGVAYILVDASGNNSIAVYPGANAFYGKQNVETAAARFDEVSFLSLELEIPLSGVERLCFEAKKHDLPTVIDAGPIRPELDARIFRGAFLLSPNRSEAQALTGLSVGTEKEARDACRALFEYGVTYAHIKLGAEGSVCYDGRDFIFCPAFETTRPVLDTTAAGDCYMAALCYRLSVGCAMYEAMRFASVAAGISVTRRGAIPSLPTNQEVADFFSD